MDLEYIRHTTEFQVFDRKSVKIEPKAFAVPIVAMANADGGVIALGVEDDGALTGATIWQHEVVGNGYDGYDSGYDNGYDGYELSARQKLVITALKANPRVSLPELAKQCGAGKTTIQRDMDDLKARGIVERDGSSKSGVWIVKI